MNQTSTRPLPAAAMAALLLAACEARETATPAAPPAPAPRAAHWTLQASATAGSAIVFADEQGTERLRIACRRNPPDLHAAAPQVPRIGSEERLTLGAGDALATLVVSQDTPQSAGVTATGQLAPGFVDALAAGREIGVSYGATQFRLEPPPADVRTAFAAACRAALAG